MTIIIHPFKQFKTTKNTITLWFFTFVRWDLLAELQKGIKMYKELKADKKILDNLINNQRGNGHQKTSNQGKGY